MRIQHNIMAMNAYRNYNINTKALSGNLEKLSSGYKINRAGDDAAGLAISEKMRAQITGLNAAQKNVKDGVSLVKTAEGAMQEIQDMLNRMDYLATQSANGTYQDQVDRENLQKEVENLKTEINRIADSANFNGIKLLDGSLDSKATGVGATKAEAGTVSSIVTSTVGQTLGTNTILHSNGVEAAETEFGVDLHEVAFSNKTGEKLTLTIGNNKFTLEGGAHGTAGIALKASDIAAAFAAGEFKDKDGNAIDPDAVSLTNDTKTGNFAVKAENNRIVFTQAEGEDPVNGDMNVTVEGTATAGKNPTVTGTIAGTFAEGTAGAVAAKQTYELTISGLTNLTAGDYEVTIGGQTVTVTLDADVDVAGGEDANEILAEKVANALVGKFKDGFDDGATPPVDTFYDTAATGAKITLEASTNGTGATAVTGGITITAKPVAAGADPVTGDYNKTTTVTAQGAKEAAGRIASGVAKLDATHFADGSIIKVGDKEYTVSTDAKDKDDATKIYVGDLKLDTPDGLKTAIDRLSVAADSNSVWTIGHGATAGQVTFVEKVDANGKSYTDQNSTNGKLNDGAFDLSKEAVIKETFGTVTGKKEAEAGKDGKPLTLQIGDTSDKFNQMEVDVGDMHTKAMGTEGGKSIADINIGTQDGAKEAVNVIKDAINYVSSVRGDLGAIQNRLEHTQNNLSVMAENIQDAESTIRDTDVAEEMMSYVKNNILVQSAQAMLAQANQVPQGVLQLLG